MSGEERNSYGLVLQAFLWHGSVADPDPGSGIGAFLTPGSGKGFFRIPDPKSIFLRAYYQFFG
jgi:hypothetical protein